MPRHTVLEFLLHTTTKIGAIFMENTTTNPDVPEVGDTITATYADDVKYIDSRTGELCN